MITADVTIRLQVNADALTPQVEAALEALADVMLVQAEDGLYLLGSKEAYDPDQHDGGNLFVAEIEKSEIASITVPA